MTKLIRKLLGWCPMKEPVQKEEEFMFSNENRTSMFLKSNSRIFLEVPILFLLCIYYQPLSRFYRSQTPECFRGGSWISTLWHRGFCSQSESSRLFSRLALLKEMVLTIMPAKYPHSPTSRLQLRSLHICINP